MDEMTGFIGVKQDVMIRAVLIILETPLMYIAVLGFAITLALVLSFIYAWHHIARRQGGSV